jgi:adenylate cyclase
VGDAVLAVFGSPEPDEQQWEKGLCVRRSRCGSPSANYPIDGNSASYPRSRSVIGIHSGEAMHGFVGSPQRMEYTVIGDTVNRASRYCDGAGPGEVVISPAVYQHVDRLVRHFRI